MRVCARARENKQKDECCRVLSTTRHREEKENVCRFEIGRDREKKVVHLMCRMQK